MVVVKVKIVRQCGVVVIAANPDTIRAFVKRIKKCPIYITLNDFNWFLALWWINWRKKMYNAKKWPARLFSLLACHPRYNNIFIIVKRFIKYNKFILVNEFHLIKDLIDTIIRKIINNYRLLNKFVTNKSITFALRFFIAFIIRFGINNKLSITFYLQTNKQIKRFNQTIE